MNKLLPNKEDLFPITLDRKTFSETPFNKEFDELSIKDQLQILNDIIRQTMAFDIIPNPENDVETLIGDSYTASKISIEYLKKLNIGKNHRSVFARQKPFEPNDIGTMHILTLVDDDLGNTYQFDCSPFVGYKCGKVENLKDNPFYKDYVPIEGDIKDIFEKMRSTIYTIHNSEIDKDNLTSYMEIINNAKKYSVLHSYVSYCYLLLASKVDNKYDRDMLLQESKIYNPYIKGIGCDKKEEYKNILALTQVKIWQEELRELQKDDSNYQRQIELSQCIMKVLNDIYPTKEPSLLIDGKQIAFSHLTPRIFLDKNLNVVLVKPSAFKLGVESSIKDTFLKHGNGAIGEYYPNLGGLSENGIKTMRIFHPHGYKYERSMTGPSDLFLVKEKAETILHKKHELRNSLGTNIANKEVLWFDNKPIIWDPIITNLVHTTDDPSEACMHYLCAYPEYQLMTRFMYPNPILEKEEKHARIRI